YGRCDQGGWGGRKGERAPPETEMGPCLRDVRPRRHLSLRPWPSMSRRRLVTMQRGCPDGLPRVVPKTFRSRLMAWGEANRRDFYWRSRPLLPFEMLVVEVL